MTEKEGETQRARGRQQWGEELNQTMNEREQDVGITKNDTEKRFPLQETAQSTLT